MDAFEFCSTQCLVASAQGVRENNAGALLAERLAKLDERRLWRLLRRSDRRRAAFTARRSKLAR